MDIKYKLGDMKKYIVKKTFALGDKGITLAAGDDVLFDGTHVEYGGESFTHPQLRGAVKVGWLVTEAQYDDGDTHYVPVSAGVQVRPAIEQPGSNPLSPTKRTAITTAENDERIVGNSAQHAESTRSLNATAKANQSGGYMKTARGMGVVEDQGAVVLNRKIKTPAKGKNEISPDNIGAAIRATAVTIDPGEGRSEEDMLRLMTEEQRESYLSEKESRKASVMARAPGSAKMIGSTNKVVGKVKTAKKASQSEGINVTTTAGGGTEITDLSGSEEKPQVSESYVEGIKVTNTNGPKRDHMVQPARPESRIVKDGTEDWRRRIAKAICADFPNDYSFTEHWKRRLAMIRLHFEERPDVIRAIFAAESDDFKAVLMEEFPDVFAEASV